MSNPFNEIVEGLLKAGVPQEDINAFVGEGFQKVIVDNLQPVMKFEFNKWYVLPKPEVKRVYHYIKDGVVHGCSIDGVVAFCISSSGNHRLIRSEGSITFVTPGWLTLDCMPAMLY